MQYRANKSILLKNLHARGWGVIWQRELTLGLEDGMHALAHTIIALVLSLCLQVSQEGTPLSWFIRQIVMAMSVVTAHTRKFIV